ncbi:hypothetical protein [Gordonia soli]|uniref:Uncharacterized protein n=1 Tax=Gordonia soli NBRC 108243 TaxID=1223545 RepID=M0QS89_9ACTN|nr:hypothetical protein [Gordonia soli]GAC71027.1 hypothetical protein GS4_47_00170 [Gordonia soli NBRC 108243]
MPDTLKEAVTEGFWVLAECHAIARGARPMSLPGIPVRESILGQLSVVEAMGTDQQRAQAAESRAFIEESFHA